MVIDGALLANLAGLATFVEIAREVAGDSLPFDQVQLLSWTFAGGGGRIGDGSVLAVALTSGYVELGRRNSRMLGSFVLEVDGESGDREQAKFNILIIICLISIDKDNFIFHLSMR